MTMASSPRNSSVDLDLEEGKKDANLEMIENISQSQGHDGPGEGAWASAKKNPIVILYSVGACASSMLWGFDIGVALPIFILRSGF